MPFVLKSQFDGLDDVRRMLRAVGGAVAKKGLKKAVTKATQRLAKAVKRNVPKRLPGNIASNQFYRGGQLKKALGSKVKQYKEAVVGIVGARTNFRIQVGVRTRDGSKSSTGDPIYINPTKYLHLVELGTSHSKGSHFMRDTLTAESPGMAQDMTDVISDAIAEVTG